MKKYKNCIVVKGKTSKAKVTALPKKITLPERVSVIDTKVELFISTSHLRKYR